MKTKIIQFIPVALALLAIGFSYFSFWCTGFGHLCYRSWLDSIFLDIINPLYFFSLFLLPIAIVLAFVQRSIFNSWLKLAVWALPLLLILIATQPVVSSFLSTNRDDAARLAGGVFAVVSLVLILWKSFFSRRIIRT